MIEKGDFVYNPRKSAEAPYGPVSIYKYDTVGIVSPLYLCFRAFQPINPSFINFFFKSTSWHRYVYLSGDSGARHDRVSIKDDVFFAMPICIPSPNEQEKLNTFLNLIESRIEKQRKLVECLKKYKRGLINRYFRLFEEKWDRFQLSSILFERKTYCEKDGTYEHATLSKEGVFGKTDRYDRDYLVADENKKYKITKIGDICYNPANLKFGVICLNTYGDAIFSPIYVTFEVDRKFDRSFIGLCLTRNDFIKRALRFQQGTVYERMAVSPDDLLTMTISVPSIEKQKAFSKAIATLDNQIEMHSILLNNLKEMKTGFMQMMFI